MHAAKEFQKYQTEASHLLLHIFFPVYYKYKINFQKINMFCRMSFLNIKLNWLLDMITFKNAADIKIF